MNKFFNTVIQDLDNDSTLKRVYQWVYYITGVLSFAPTAYVIYTLFSRDLLLGHFSWGMFLGIVFSLVWFVSSLAVSFIMFKYWKQHGDQLVDVMPSGNPYPNILFAADYLKCFSYSTALLYCTPIIIGAVLVFLWFVLTGEEGFYRDSNFFKALGYLLSAVVGIVLLAILFILFLRCISERMYLRVNVANDLRDLGDIYRNAAIVKNEADSDKPETVSNDNLE